MSIIVRPAAPTHDLGHAHFTSLATPSRGSSQTSVWEVELMPGAPATPHSLTHEEVFVVLEGTATVVLDGVRGEAHTGDAIVVAPAVQVELTNETEGVVRMLCCLPVGGQAQLTNGTTFTPPWAE